MKSFSQLRKAWKEASMAAYTAGNVPAPTQRKKNKFGFDVSKYMKDKKNKQNVSLMRRGKISQYRVAR
jgi:hypothetical protein